MILYHEGRVISALAQDFHLQLLRYKIKAATLDSKAEGTLGLLKRR